MSISLNNIESRVTALENKSIESSMKVKLLLDANIREPHNKTFNLIDSIKNYDELLFVVGGDDTVASGAFKTHYRFYVPEINNTDRYSPCVSATDNNIFLKFISNDKIHVYYAYSDSYLYKIYGIKYILNLYYKFKEVISYVNLLK